MQKNRTKKQWWDRSDWIHRTLPTRVQEARLRNIFIFAFICPLLFILENIKQNVHEVAFSFSSWKRKYINNNLFVSFDNNNLFVGFDANGLQPFEGVNFHHGDQRVQFVGGIFIVVVTASQSDTTSLRRVLHTLRPHKLVEASVNTHVRRTWWKIRSKFIRVNNAQPRISITCGDHFPQQYTHGHTDTHCAIRPRERGEA